MPDQTRKQTRKEKVVLPLLFTDTRKPILKIVLSKFCEKHSELSFH